MENQTDQSRPPSSKESWWTEFKTFAKPLLKMDKGEWLEDMRGNLSMVTSLISAITFQAALNPPGGLVQTSTGPENTPIGCNSTVGLRVNRNICTGQAVLAVRKSGSYRNFLIFNTFSFVASLSAALLLVSGIPLRHRFPMWFLSMAMSASLTSLAIAYLFGVALVNTNHILNLSENSFEIFMWIWIGFLAFVCSFFFIRLLVWLEKNMLQAKQGSKDEKGTSSVSLSTRL